MNQQTHDKYKVMFDQRYIGGIIKKFKTSVIQRESKCSKTSLDNGLVPNKKKIIKSKIGSEERKREK